VRIVKFLLLVMVAGSAWATVPVEQPVTLQPSVEHRFTSSVAVRMLNNWHYKTTRLDDELSAKILDGYVKMLDPNRSYFLATDVSGFDQYRSGLDEALRHSDLLPAFDMFNIYLDRVRQRVTYAREQLKQPFDFSVDEYFVYDRTAEPWAANQAELDEQWRQRVKNDYLRLKLTDKEHDEIIELLDERYENLERRVRRLLEARHREDRVVGHRQAVERQHAEHRGQGREQDRQLERDRDE